MRGWAVLWGRDRLRGGARTRFVCNACGHRTSWTTGRMTREGRSCGWCGATVRTRAVLDAISLALHGDHLVATDWPRRHDVRALGFSDNASTAAALGRTTSYLNTWHHQQPLRDLLDLSTFGGERYDLIVCSDVIEHVQRPVERAIANLFSLLAPDGNLVLSAPATREATVEHFPELASYEVVSTPGGSELHATTTDGEPFVAGDLIFHGGPGATMEMRLLARDHVTAMLKDAGFSTVEELRDGHAPFGIVYDGVDEPRARPDGHPRGTEPGVWLAVR